MLSERLQSAVMSPDASPRRTARLMWSIIVREDAVLIRLRLPAKAPAIRPVRARRVYQDSAPSNRLGNGEGGHARRSCRVRLLRWRPLTCTPRSTAAKDCLGGLMTAPIRGGFDDARAEFEPEKPLVFAGLGSRRSSSIVVVRPLRRSSSPSAMAAFVSGISSASSPRSIR